MHWEQLTNLFNTNNKWLIDLLENIFLLFFNNLSALLLHEINVLKYKNKNRKILPTVPLRSWRSICNHMQFSIFLRFWNFLVEILKIESNVRNFGYVFETEFHIIDKNFPGDWTRFAVIAVFFFSKNSIF